MDKQEVAQQIIDFTAMAYKVDADNITADTAFEELGKESLKMIALASNIENELDAEVTLEEIMKMQTVGELVDRVLEEL